MNITRIPILVSRRTYTRSNLNQYEEKREFRRVLRLGVSLRINEFLETSYKNRGFRNEIRPSS